MLAHLCVKVFFTDAFEEGFTADFNTILCLGDIHAIEEGDKSEAFEWDGEVAINRIKNTFGDSFHGCGFCKIIDLME